MVLNARQKVCVAVLAVGIVALAVDRVFVLPKSAPASEQRTPVDNYSVPSAQGETAPFVQAARTSVTAAQRLEAAWSEKNLSFEASRDLFSLPGSWRPGPAPGETNRASGAARGRFVANHKLKAIIIDEAGKRALIDDRLVRLGEELDGHVLVGVTSESVAFEREGERIVLRLVKDR